MALYFILRSEGGKGEKGDVGPTGPPGLPGEKGARGKRGKRVRMHVNSSLYTSLACCISRLSNARICLKPQLLHFIILFIPFIFCVIFMSFQTIYYLTALNYHLFISQL